MATDAIDRFRITHARAIAALRSRGNADRWGLGDDPLAIKLHASIEAWARTLDAPPADRAVVEYLDGLRAEDLVLACACRIGIADAWEYFIAHYRGMLMAAARALVRDESRAREPSSVGKARSARSAKNNSARNRARPVR